MQVIPYVLMIAGGLAKSKGQQEEGAAIASMYQYKAALARQSAELAKGQAKTQIKAIGETAESNITAVQGAAAQESKRLAGYATVLTGAQKAAIGAMGVGGVTAEDIVGSTFDKIRLDELALRYNANVKSYQFREQAKQDVWKTKEETKSKLWSLGTEIPQYELAGRNAEKAGKRKAFGTLLSTASTVGGMASK